MWYQKGESLDMLTYGTQTKLSTEKWYILTSKDFYKLKIRK